MLIAFEFKCFSMKTENLPKYHCLDGIWVCGIREIPIRHPQGVHHSWTSPLTNNSSNSSPVLSLSLFVYRGWDDRTPPFQLLLSPGKISLLLHLGQFNKDGDVNELQGQELTAIISQGPSLSKNTLTCLAICLLLESKTLLIVYFLPVYDINLFSLADYNCWLYIFFYFLCMKNHWGLCYPTDQDIFDIFFIIDL